MKIKRRDLIIVLALVIVVIGVTFYYYNFNERQVGTERYDKLSTNDFISLMDDSTNKHAWFYLYNNNEAQYGGVNKEDTIERIYIAKNGQAKLYRDKTGKNPTFSDFEGLSPLAVVQRIEANMIPGYDFEASGDNYIFLAAPSGSNEVTITIKNPNNLSDGFQFEQTVPSEDIVTDISVGTLTLSGYLHQSENASVFNKYQTLALLTPIELVVD